MEASLNEDIAARETNASLKEFRKRRTLLANREDAHKLLKKGIWLYFLLLVFEGALRKWVLPGLATPLLVVRDPLAIWLLYIAWRYDELPSNQSVLFMSVISIFSFFTAITLGHGSIVVAVYGVRILLFHFPLIFLIGRIFDREDVLKMGKIMLWMSIPMAFLIALQFYSPQSAFVNKGIGSDSQGGGFSGALGYFRPPGTFSFTTGNTQFFGVVGAFIIYFWLNPTQINRILLIASSACLLAAIPLSISRSLLFQVVLTTAFAAISIARKPKYLGRMFLAAMGIMVILAFLSRVSFFEHAIDALTSRFETASQSEGGIQDTVGNRIFAGFFEQFQSYSLPFFGLGIGMGTNAGARLLVGTAESFLISEGEWGRLVGEMGVILGVTAIVIRINVCVMLVKASYKRLLQSDLLPWILISVSLQAIAQGQWAQPTALGFATLLGGLSIASLKRRAT